MAGTGSWTIALSQSPVARIRRKTSLEEENVCEPINDARSGHAIGVEPSGAERP
jgi:hypothetical protein